jgi:poly(A) polymerase
MSVTNVSATELGIKTQSISKNALKVVRDLQAAGYQAYLVGGCVRDLIVGRHPKDFDVSTNATPEQIKKTFRNARIIGRRFKLVHVRFGYEVIEVATFRADANDRDKVSSQEMSEGDQGQLLRDNVYGTLEEDVVRRDFRANALYYDSEANIILDFVGGIEDIKEKKLVSIGEPKQRFREDPVRMLRVVRFAAKLGFEMEPQAMEMIEEEGKLLAHVSAARLFEEVLKLFHGGAAYDTYIMLRKYGLFKYLFPFTDQGVLDDVEGMPERALKNTDKRIHAGKPVIPAFLFACMLWDPVRTDAQILMQDGTPEAQAWRIAMDDGLRDQNQYVAVPRRLAEIILDIWNIHFRLIKRNPRMVKACLSNRRFRAAYDFLLLRVALHEVDGDIGDWWTRIQEVEDSEREEMISKLGKVNKDQQRENELSSGETNGNSINYNARQEVTTGRKRASKGKKKQGKKRHTKKNAGGQRRRQGQEQTADQGNGNSYGNSVGNSIGNGPAKKGKRRNKRGGPRSRPSGSPQSDRGFSDAQPKDNYGNYQLSSPEEEARRKKVKVRRKRRVADTDNNPHF